MFLRHYWGRQHLESLDFTALIIFLYFVSFNCFLVSHSLIFIFFIGVLFGFVEYFCFLVLEYLFFFFFFGGVLVLHFTFLVLIFLLCQCLFVCFIFYFLSTLLLWVWGEIRISKMNYWAFDKDYTSMCMPKMNIWRSPSKGPATENSRNFLPTSSNSSDKEPFLSNK